MLAEFLSMAGFRITAVDSAIDAVTLDFDNFFAVVTDLAMPRMDGRWYRFTLHGPGIAVVRGIPSTLTES
jgi:CheY-like chemotaxis protein